MLPDIATVIFTWETMIIPEPPVVDVLVVDVNSDVVVFSLPVVEVVVEVEPVVISPVVEVSVLVVESLVVTVLSVVELVPPEVRELVVEELVDCVVPVVPEVNWPSVELFVGLPVVVISWDEVVELVEVVLPVGSYPVVEVEEPVVVESPVEFEERLVVVPVVLVSLSPV